jgi:primosomal protein N' (replication factor Y)
VATCPRCDTPLTYHGYGPSEDGATGDLRCHHCGYQARTPATCPECGSRRIKYFGAGTQHIEQAIKQHFPDAVGLRWDADTAAKPEAHDIILQRFASRQADVLIGTQMIAKGLDLPLVTLVGVVSADMGLALPDFRAGERSFQLLTQVAGRAGRGLLGGRVVLQTYQPEHYAVAAAARHDYATFYGREIEYRRELGYPPFRRMARVLFHAQTDREASANAHRVADLIQARMAQLEMTGTELIGPAPCFFSKRNTLFRWHLLLRGPDPTAALRGLDPGRGAYIDIDPVELL